MRARAFWEPKTVLVTGAGPIGLLAALHRRAARSRRPRPRPGAPGPKPELVRALGATYHSGAVADIGFEPDVIIECTGVGQVIADSIRHGRRRRGRLPHRRRQRRAASGLLPADVATGAGPANNVVVGSVNANRRHFYRAAEALAAADRAWLGRLISRRVAPENIADALKRSPDDIKVVVDFGG